MHSWMSSDDNSATEVDLEPGRYRISSGCSVDRVVRTPGGPLVRTSKDGVVFVDTPNPPPTEVLSPVRLDGDGAFTVRRAGLYRVRRPRGISRLDQETAQS